MATNPPAPIFVVEDSPLKASITTFFSLLFFGITLAGAILHLASAKDLNGIRALMMRQDTIAFFTTVSPFAWAVWRTRRTWFKTKVDAVIAKSAPDAVAMPKSEVPPILFSPAEAVFPPPTRSRETTTRLVDAKLLHRIPTEAITSSGIAAGFTGAGDLATMSGAPEQPLERGELEPTARMVDVLITRGRPDNSDAFNAIYREYHTGPQDVTFKQHLEANGWAWDGKRWQAPTEGEEAAPEIPGDALSLPVDHQSV